MRTRSLADRCLILTTVALLAASIVDPASAQDRPPPAVEFAAGWVGFADDGVVSEGTLGGGARYYVSPRMSLGPEILVMWGDKHSHLIATGNVTWDVIAPRNGSPGGITPFIVAGGGLFQTRERFPVGGFTSSEGAFTAGGGVRSGIGRRVTLAIDTRIGWELHVRVNGVVGLRLGP